MSHMNTHNDTQPAQMNPMDKFVSQFQQFCEHEGIKDLSDDNKVTLFSGYCQAVIAKYNNQPKQVAKSAPKPQSRNSNSGSHGYTGKQKGMIMRLVKGGYLTEPDWSILSIRGASKLIDKGLAAERRGESSHEPEETESKPQGEFTGSYSLC